MNDINRLQQQLVEFRNQRDWTKFHNPKDVTISLVLEASELLEHFQWKNQTEIDTYVKEHKNDIAEEMADVFNWLLILSHDLKIDLVKALDQKIEKNAAKYPVQKAKGNHKKYTEL